jgi:hypothetical protein
MNISHPFPFQDLLPEMRGEVRIFLDPFSRLHLRWTCKALHAEDKKTRLLPLLANMYADFQRDDYENYRDTPNEINPLYISYFNEWMELGDVEWLRWLGDIQVGSSETREKPYARYQQWPRIINLEKMCGYEMSILIQASCPREGDTPVSDHNVTLSRFVQDNTGTCSWTASLIYCYRCNSGIFPCTQTPYPTLAALVQAKKQEILTFFRV